METTRKEIRQNFKDIGYKVSFKSFSFNRSICYLQWKDSEMVNYQESSSSSVFSAEFYNKHKTAFELSVKYKGYLLVDTEQKIGK